METDESSTDGLGIFGTKMSCRLPLLRVNIRMRHLTFNSKRNLNSIVRKFSFRTLSGAEHSYTSKFETIQTGTKQQRPLREKFCWKPEVARVL